MPIGFKNATSGDVQARKHTSTPNIQPPNLVLTWAVTQVAADAVQAAAAKHSFLSVTPQGLCAIVHTHGNAHGHVILRGGAKGTNYDSDSVANAVAVLTKSGAPTNVVVDCSHGNSLKKHTNQPGVAAEVGRQVAQGNHNLVGVMIESNIKAGNQKLKPGETVVESLEYGVSVTDACVDLEATAEMLAVLARAVRQRKAHRSSPETCPPSDPEGSPCPHFELSE